ncbi:MAG: hypothetical protein OEW05_13320 [Candidatus Aminicenantes bacterium]|nr:hypothetical protein [Candidatus Aminicenantes bacterium]
MIPCEEKYDQIPICPHCQASLDRIYCRRLTSVFGKRYVYFCPQCRKTLGVSHRKGFWMG